jgi:membrane protease YdiL (CAAX protease family)
VSRRELGTGLTGLLKAIGWSVAFVVVGVVIGLPVVVGLGALVKGPAGTDWFAQPGLPQLLVQGFGLVVGFGLATLLIGRKAVGRTWEELRWRAPQPAGPWFARGLALGAAAAGGAMVLGLAAAGARWSTTTGSPLDWARSAFLTGGALALPALSEELIFRGVPLVLLAGVVGRWPAVVVTSIAFGFSHWTNPDITALGIVNISLAGVLLGTAFFAPGGIWTAWGAHFGWNLALAALAAPVSGLPMAIPAIAYAPGGPTWLSGGAFGPEGGLLATTTMLAATAVAAKWITKSGETT